MKKTLSILLAVALMMTAVFSALALPAFAEVEEDTEITFTVSDTHGALNETVEVDFSISADSHLVNMDLVVSYPADKLELLKGYKDRSGDCYAVINTEVLPGMSAIGVPAPGTFKLAYADSYNTDVAGKMFSLKFKIIAEDVLFDQLECVASPIGANWQDPLDPTKDYVPVTHFTGGKITIDGGYTTTTTKPIDEIDLLDFDKIVSHDGIEVTNLGADGWLLEASNGTSSLGLAGCGMYDAAHLMYTHCGIASAVPYTIAFYDAVNNKWMTSNGDFYPDFGAAPGGDVPAGTVTLALFTNGCYTWAGDPLPEVVEMSSIYIEPKAAGQMVVGTLKLSKESSYTEATPTLPSVVTTTTGLPYQIGDANMDGNVNMKDASLIFRFGAGGKNPESALQKDLSDVNRDGVVDMKDARAIFKKVSQ